MTKLSILISIFSGKDQQFNVSLRSLTKYSYDPAMVELLVFIDYPKNKSTQLILKKYRKYFSSIKIFSVISKKNNINHSATRRNFLATKAVGEYIIFSEPEMYHANNTIGNLLSYLKKNKNLNEWVCGPVYAGRDMVNSSGMFVDDCINPQNLTKLLTILELPKLFSNIKFKANYYLVDYSYYDTPFFFAMFYRKTFLSIRGLNQNLKVRGFEELELYKRFARNGGKVIVNTKIPTIHIPHVRNLDKESQIGWNIYNSSVRFDEKQLIGQITDADFQELNLS